MPVLFKLYLGKLTRRRPSSVASLSLLVELEEFEELEELVELDDDKPTV